MDKEKRLSGISPGRSLFIAALVSLFLGASSFFLPFLLAIWQISILILIPIFVIDAIILVFWMDKLNVQREIATTLALGRSVPVKIRITPVGKCIILSKFKVFDIYDDSFDCDSMPITVSGPKFADKSAKSGKADIFLGWELQYFVLPKRRGIWEFKICHLLFSSMFHFWRLKTVMHVESRGRTYPDFTALVQSGNLQALLKDAGEKRVRRRGAGLEFESLRDFQNGDTIRSIDWRATSRRQKFTVREYQVEQDQNVLFLMDSGYRLNRRGDDFSLMFWPSVRAWRERRACWSQPPGRMPHQGQSSTGWRTMIHHRAVAPRSGQAACRGNWQLGQGWAGQRGRQLQAADIRLAPDPAPFPDILLCWRVGRTMRGCPLLLSLSRTQREPRGKRPAGMRR